MLSQVDLRVPFYHKGQLIRKGKQRNYQKMPLYVDFLDVDKLISQVEVMALPMKVTLVTINLSAF